MASSSSVPHARLRQPASSSALNWRGPFDIGNAAMMSFAICFRIWWPLPGQYGKPANAPNAHK
jgi:hypothetical protein